MQPRFPPMNLGMRPHVEALTGLFAMFGFFGRNFRELFDVCALLFEQFSNKLSDGVLARVLIRVWGRGKIINAAYSATMPKENTLKTNKKRSQNFRNLQTP